MSAVVQARAGAGDRRLPRRLDRPRGARRSLPASYDTGEDLHDPHRVSLAALASRSPPPAARADRQRTRRRADRRRRPTRSSPRPRRQLRATSSMPARDRTGSTRPTSPTIPTRWPPKSGAEITELAVKLCARARRSIDDVAGAVARHQAQARPAAQRRSRCPRRRAPGAAERAGDADDADVVAPTARARARSTASRSTARISRRRWATDARSRQAEGDVDQLARQCRRADARRLRQDGRASPTRARRELGYHGHRRDVALGLRHAARRSSPR